jgi:hypothetical protein
MNLSFLVLRWPFSGGNGIIHGGQLTSLGIAVFRQLAIIAWRHKSTGTHAQGQINEQSTHQQFNFSKVPSIKLDGRPLPQETSHFRHEQNTHFSLSLPDYLIRLW